jgi:hypothetical protein
MFFFRVVRVPSFSSSLAGAPKTNPGAGRAHVFYYDEILPDTHAALHFSLIPPGWLHIFLFDDKRASFLIRC